MALGAGFCDGLGFGGNTKAAIIRIGLNEMRRFCEEFYGSRLIKLETFLESCGVADLVTTCFGGRNRLCAEIFAKDKANGTATDWATIEAAELNGQKLQGTGTCEDVMKALKAKGVEGKFPFFVQIHKISFEDASPSSIVEINTTDYQEPAPQSGFDKLQLSSVDVKGKRVLIRVDFNVPQVMRHRSHGTRGTQHVAQRMRPCEHRCAAARREMPRVGCVASWLHC